MPSQGKAVILYDIQFVLNKILNNILGSEGCKSSIYVRIRLFVMDCLLLFKHKDEHVHWHQQNRRSVVQETN